MNILSLSKPCLVRALAIAAALLWLTAWSTYAKESGRQRLNIVLNLIGQHPAKVAELAAQWHVWATQVGALK